MLGLALDERHRPAQSVGVTDLDHTRIERCLVKQRLRDGGGVSVILRAEVDRLDERLCPLAAERLGEAGHGSAEHAERAGVVVAVTSAKARCADEERRLRQSAHRRGEQLHAHVERVATSRRREFRDRSLEVEAGQPEHAVD